MRTVFLTAIILSVGLLKYTWSQNFIKLKNNKVLEDISIIEIKPEIVVYIQRGSSHDVEISRIEHIVNDGVVITFDGNNIPQFNTYSGDSIKKNVLWPFSVIDNSSRSDSRHLLKISATSWIDYDAGVQIGIESLLKDKLSVQNEFGYLFYSPFATSFNNNNNRKDIKGYSYRFEIRRYFLSKHPLTGVYFSPNLSYKLVNWVEETPLPWDQNTGTIWVETKTNNSVYTLNLKLGYQHIAKNRMVIDIFAGAGIRYKNSNFSTNNQTLLQQGFILKKERVLPNLVGGFKLGFPIL